QCPPTRENPHGYHRLIGGGVEMGETHRDAVIREVREELDASIRDLTYLDAVESIYAINGQTGHEIVFVYTGRLDPEPARAGARLRESDGAVLPVVWRPLHDAAETLPLYPAGSESDCAVAFRVVSPRLASSPLRDLLDLGSGQCTMGIDAEGLGLDSAASALIARTPWALHCPRGVLRTCQATSSSTVRPAPMVQITLRHPGTSGEDGTEGDAEDPARGTVTELS
ncbi:MAG: NUDIX domain-containing protein, partial [Lapillicoccus sp.]